MALKDTWKDLENHIEGVPDSGEMASADDINNIAHAVIEIEKNVGGEGLVDTEMSEISTNAVQNKIIKKYVDQSIQTAILDSWEVEV